MKLLATIRQSDVDSTFGEDANVSYVERHAARAVLLDDRGRIALMYAGVNDYYKLPGGGVESGEDMHTALARELMEEVGANVRVISEIGRVEEWRVLKDDAMHQVSDAYIARVKGELQSPAFTDKELAEGFEVRWVNGFDEAMKLLADNMDHNKMNVRFMSMRDHSILSAAKISF